MFKFNELNDCFVRSLKTMQLNELSVDGGNKQNSQQELTNPLEVLSLILNLIMSRSFSSIFIQRYSL